MKNKPLFALMTTFAAIVAIVSYFLFIPINFGTNGTIVDIPAGTSKHTFISKLSQQGLLPHPVIFSLYIYPQASRQLKAGEYFFPPNSTMVSIWRQVTTGTGLYYRPIMIVPGWTFKQVRAQLMATSGLHQTISQLSPEQVMLKITGSAYSPEGQFFPETYYYTKGDSDLSILKRAYLLMQKKFNQAWAARANNLPYQSAYEALIAASLVEREAYLDTERPRIAGVIINRLRKQMLLQIDPTVIYGMGDRYTGNISKKDLREDTPYNTYVHKGLPPTPIAIPSLSSIEAVMHPEQNAYYYYVAKGDGSHQFSKSLSEHNAAVAASIKNKKQPSAYFNHEKVRKYFSVITSAKLLIAESSSFSTYKTMLLLQR